MVRRTVASGMTINSPSLKHEPATASSIVGNALENMPEYIKKGIDEGVLQGAAATAWFAGTDTVIYLRTPTSLEVSLTLA